MRDGASRPRECDDRPGETAAPAHPGPLELTQYVRGRLASGHAVAVLAHCLVCPACAACLRALLAAGVGVVVGTAPEDLEVAERG